jgi:hypothetical protein
MWSTMKSRQTEGKSKMRILNRAIVTAVLTVPMALGISGVAVADAAVDSSVPQNQVGVLDTNRSVEGNSEEDTLDLDLVGGSDERESDDEDLGDDIRQAIGVGDDERSDQDGFGESEDDDVLEILGDEDDGDSGDNSLLG